VQFPNATSLAMVSDDANGMRDLNTLVDESGIGWQLSIAHAINATGQILVNRPGFSRHLRASN
jgi:hypothetical protein